MPLYRFAVLEGLTTDAQRAHIAKEVVRIHCGVTAAPPSLVHAFFAEATSSALPDGKSVFVVGSIRSGRTDEQKAQIVAELTDSIATTIGRQQTEVGVVTVDVPAKWIMEGGELLPEPGEEEAWLARR